MGEKQLPRVRLFGLKRSGTNLLEWFLKKYFHNHLEVAVNARRWKHARPQFTIDDDRAIIIYKEELAWWESNRRYIDPPGEELHGFGEWKAWKAEADGLAMRNPSGVLMIEYQDLASDPDGVGRKISEWMAMPRAQWRENFPLPSKRMGFTGNVTPRAFVPRAVPRFSVDEVGEARGDSQILNIGGGLGGIGDAMIALIVAKSLEADGRKVQLWLRQPLFARVFHEDAFRWMKRPEGTIDIMADYYSHLRRTALGGVTRLDCYIDKLPRGIFPKRVVMPEPVGALPEFPEASGAVLCFPFSTQRCRTWPMERWRRLVELLHGQGLKAHAAGPARRREEMAGIFDKTHVGLPWRRVCGLIRSARLSIANDSGPLHVAAALGAETIGVMATIKPSAFAFYGPHVRFVVPWGGETCAGCHFQGSRGWKAAGRACRGAGEPRCSELEKIPPRCVANMVRRILEGKTEEPYPGEAEA